jgi:hypothetical protein
MEAVSRAIGSFKFNPERAVADFTAGLEPGVLVAAEMSSIPSQIHSSYPYYFGSERFRDAYAYPNFAEFFHRRCAENRHDLAP